MSAASPLAHPAPAATALSDAEYQTRTRAVLDAIEAQVDQWLDSDWIDIDTHRSGGLLELSFPDRSKIIINTQAPLQELWLAAKAGGFHYRFVAGQWLDTRDASEFLAHLSQLASAQAGKALNFATV